MTIDKDTKLIARLHIEDNGRGLNIYNPYFEAAGINAVYMLFVNKEPKPLVDGLRNLQVSGAIPAGFEKDAVLPTLVDEKTEAVKLANRVGIIANRGGKLFAHYQGGEGLLSAIKEKLAIGGKNLVIVGSGTVAKTLILAITESEDRPASITVLNRTLDHARQLQDRFPDIVKANPLEDLASIEGDIIVNTTCIGSTVEDTYFTADIVNKFQAAVDVTFANPKTNLIRLSQEHGAVTITGWDMFTHQAVIVLRELLNHEANIPLLRKHVEKGLAEDY